MHRQYNQVKSHLCDGWVYHSSSPPPPPPPPNSFHPIETHLDPPLILTTGCTGQNGTNVLNGQLLSNIIHRQVKLSLGTEALKPETPLGRSPMIEWMNTASGQIWRNEKGRGVGGGGLLLSLRWSSIIDW